MDEHDPVDDGEFVYRRIHRNQFDGTAEISVQFPAFRPNQNDMDGVSLFRARFLQPADTLAHINESKAKDYYVARIAVRDLRNLGLTLKPDPIPGGPAGHVIVPELNWPAYHTNTQTWKPIIVELARLASADVVHRPVIT